MIQIINQIQQEKVEMSKLLTKNIREFILEPFKLINKIHFSECENILSESKKMEKEAKETLEKCEKVLLWFI